MSGSISVTSSVGFVPQSPLSLLGTVHENIILDSKINRKKYEKVITACCLIPDLEQFGGDQVDLSKRSVSGGQQQRIALARALYHDSKLLLLDNPTSALDPPIAAQIMNSLSKDFPFNALLISLLDHKWTKGFSQVVMLSGRKMLPFKSIDKIPLLERSVSHKREETSNLKKEGKLTKATVIQPSNYHILKHILSFWSKSSMFWNILSVFVVALAGIAFTVAPPLWFSSQFKKYPENLMIFHLLFVALLFSAGIAMQGYTNTLFADFVARLASNLSGGVVCFPLGKYSQTDISLYRRHFQIDLQTAQQVFSGFTEIVSTIWAIIFGVAYIGYVLPWAFLMIIPYGNFNH